MRVEGGPREGDLWCRPAQSLCDPDTALGDGSGSESRGPSALPVYPFRNESLQVVSQPTPSGRSRSSPAKSERPPPGRERPPVRLLNVSLEPEGDRRLELRVVESLEALVLDHCPAPAAGGSPPGAVSSSRSSAACATSSVESILSASRSRTSRSPTRPIPSRYSTRTRVPKEGGGITASAGRSTTWLTSSATTPRTTDSPSSMTSVITMQVEREISEGGSPNFTARSSTGTTLPRRLMTPRTQPGVRGTRVTAPYWRISRTRRMPSAYSSVPIPNVRYCGCSEPAESDSISSSLEPGEIGVARVGGAVAARDAGGEDAGDLASGDDGARRGLVRGGKGGGRGRRGSAHAEEADELLERLRLRGELLRGGRQLLRRGRALLRDLVHLSHGPAHLVDALRLLRGGRGELLHDVRALLDVGRELVQELARLLGDLDAGGGEDGDLLGRALAALRELADLGRHHREALAVVPRPRRLDGRVQGEEVRLVRDLVDDRDLLRDLLHRLEGAPHRLRAVRGHSRRLRGDLQELPAVLGVLVDGGAHLLEARRRLLHRGRLLRGALGEGLGGGRDLARRGGEGGGARLDVADHAGELVHHEAERAPQRVLLRARLHRDREVALRDAGGGGRHLARGVHHAAHRGEELAGLVACVRLHPQLRVAEGDGLRDAHRAEERPGDAARDPHAQGRSYEGGGGEGGHDEQERRAHVVRHHLRLGGEALRPLPRVLVGGLLEPPDLVLVLGDRLVALRGRRDLALPDEPEDPREARLVGGGVAAHALDHLLPRRVRVQPLELGQPLLETGALVLPLLVVLADLGRRLHVQEDVLLEAPEPEGVGARALGVLDEGGLHLDEAGGEGPRGPRSPVPDGAYRPDEQTEGREGRA